jgi:tyrosine-specific transport protein
VNVNKKNQFAGPIFLVAGMAIGAGVLGLPLGLYPSGYVPALFGTLVVYLCVLASGILMARLFIADHDSDLPSLFRRHLGKFGAVAFNVSYFTLAFCLLVAYWNYISGVFHNITPLIIVIGVLFYYCLCHRFEFLEKLNGMLTVGLIISFIVMVVSSFCCEKLPLFKFANWRKLPMALPVILCSFGYHQVVPMVCRRLNYDIRSISKALAIGAAIPLAINALILTVAFRVFTFDELARAAADNGNMFSLLMGRVQSAGLAYSGQLFGIFAVTTSMLGVSMAMKGALRDVLEAEKFPQKMVEVLILIPLVMAIMKPHLFITVLGVAGGIFGNLIAGLLPVAPFLSPKRFRLRYLVLWSVFAYIFIAECMKLLDHA